VRVPPLAGVLIGVHHAAVQAVLKHVLYLLLHPKHLLDGLLLSVHLGHKQLMPGVF